LQVLSAAGCNGGNRIQSDFKKKKMAAMAAPQMPRMSARKPHCVAF
jgi:hypothetical protein